MVSQTINTWAGDIGLVVGGNISSNTIQVGGPSCDDTILKGTNVSLRPSTYINLEAGNTLLGSGPVIFLNAEQALRLETNGTIAQTIIRALGTSTGEVDVEATTGVNISTPATVIGDDASSTLDVLGPCTHGGLVTPNAGVAFVQPTWAPSRQPMKSYGWDVQDVVVQIAGGGTINPTNDVSKVYVMQTGRVVHVTFVLQFDDMGGMSDSQQFFLIADDLPVVSASGPQATLQQDDPTTPGLWAFSTTNAGSEIKTQTYKFSAIADPGTNRFELWARDMKDPPDTVGIFPHVRFMFRNDPLTHNTIYSGTYLTDDLIV